MISADERPHVMYVAWGFPPCRGGGVYRALATANAFVAAGCDVTVLTATREAFARYTGLDSSLEERVDPRIRVARVPFDWPARERDVRLWSPLRALAPRVWWRLRKRADLLPFPEYGYGPWRPKLEAAALAVHAQRPVDLVVATANPNVDFMAADVLHRRHGVPYVMDYRDAWMLDVFGGGLVHPEGGRVDTLERRLLAEAHEVWFVNEPIRRWHAERHPAVADRMHVVANGYDQQFAPIPPATETPAAPAAPQHPTGSSVASPHPLVFGYLGTASEKVPLAAFAQGWRQARHNEPALTGAQAQLWGYLGFYAAPSPELLGLLAGYESDGLSYRGPVAKADVAARYAEFDALLLLLGTGRYVTSGKVFEYTASGLPIVSVHDPGNAASDVLRGYPLWFPVASLAPDAIADALAQAARAARTASADVRADCARFARRFRRDLQLAPRVEALRKSIRTRPPRRSGQLRVVVLSTGAAPGSSGAQAQRDYRTRLGLDCTDQLQVIARRSTRATPALLTTLGCPHARELTRTCDVMVATDRAAASVAWALARINPTADVVEGWEAGTTAIRNRRG